MINEYGIGYGVFGFGGQGIQTNPFRSREKHRELPPMATVVHREQWVSLLREIFYELLASRFEWEGLPDNVPPYFLERLLITRGRALIFETEYDGIFVAGGSAEGLNHYYKPLKFTIESPTMTGTFDLSKDKAVLVENTSQGKSDVEIVERFIQILAEIKLTQSVNMQTMKTPFLLKGNHKTMRTLQEQLYQVARGNPYVMVDEELEAGDGQGLDVLVTQTPYTIDKLQEHYLEVKTELLETLGVNTNPNPRKKERMISGEIDTNLQEIAMNRMTRLRMREYAAEQASKMFNREIKVKFSEVFDDDFLDSVNSIGHNIGTGSGMDEQDDNK